MVSKKEDRELAFPGPILRGGMVLAGLVWIFWKEDESVEKHYCDVCGAETPVGHRKMVVEIEQILEGAGVEDLCCSCQEKARQIAWGDVVRAAIQRAGNTV